MNGRMKVGLLVALAIIGSLFLAAEVEASTCEARCIGICDRPCCLETCDVDETANCSDGSCGNFGCFCCCTGFHPDGTPYLNCGGTTCGFTKPGGFAPQFGPSPSEQGCAYQGLNEEWILLQFEVGPSGEVVVLSAVGDHTEGFLRSEISCFREARQDLTPGAKGRLLKLAKPHFRDSRDPIEISVSETSLGIDPTIRAQAVVRVEIGSAGRVENMVLLAMDQTFGGPSKDLPDYFENAVLSFLGGNLTVTYPSEETYRVVALLDLGIREGRVVSIRNLQYNPL